MGTHLVRVLGLWSMRVTLATYGGVALLDVPKARSAHRHPTPRGGGLAIVVGTLLGLWLAFSWPGWDLPWRAGLAYTLGAALVAAVRWLDDLWSLPNRVRFLAHAGGRGVSSWVAAPGSSLYCRLWGLWTSPVNVRNLTYST